MEPVGILLLLIGAGIFVLVYGMWLKAQRTEKLARHRGLVLDRIERGTLGYVDRPRLTELTVSATRQ